MGYVGLYKINTLYNGPLHPLKTVILTCHEMLTSCCFINFNLLCARKGIIMTLREVSLLHGFLYAPGNKIKQLRDWQATPTTFHAREKLLLEGYDCDKRRQLRRTRWIKSHASKRETSAGKVIIM